MHEDPIPDLRCGPNTPASPYNVAFQYQRKIMGDFRTNTEKLLTLKLGFIRGSSEQTVEEIALSEVVERRDNFMREEDAQLNMPHSASCVSVHLRPFT